MINKINTIASYQMLVALNSDKISVIFNIFTILENQRKRRSEQGCQIDLDNEATHEKKISRKKVTPILCYNYRFLQ